MSAGRFLANPSPCPDCGVAPGNEHLPGCDVERCMGCGHQRLCCDCGDEAGLKPDIWSGFWPGYAECVEYAIYCRWVEPTPGQPLNPGVTTGWVPCDISHPDSRPDLNRLPNLCRWNPELRTWVLKPVPIITNENTNSRGIDLT